MINRHCPQVTKRFTQFDVFSDHANPKLFSDILNFCKGERDFSDKPKRWRRTGTKDRLLPRDGNPGKAAGTARVDETGPGMETFERQFCDFDF